MRHRALIRKKKTQFVFVHRHATFYSIGWCKNLIFTPASGYSLLGKLENTQAWTKYFNW